MGDISHQIWDLKYRLKEAGGAPREHDVAESWARVAIALAEAEVPEKRAEWARIFAGALARYRFLPAGRILAGAGTSRDVTLFNCFVMGTIPDSLDGIFSHLREAALTMQQGGGIGYDFSSLRPEGAPVLSVGADASGPVSFMDVWDAMCRTIMSAGTRRGAMMATLACDHPDIETFITAKQTRGRLSMFNLSVLASDAFMEAVKADEPWELQFGGKVYRTLRARDLWDRIMRATYDYAEPGVIFIDRINARNNLGYCETIAATNPCGEQPLPPYGACLLGSINLARLIQNPFEADAALDEDELIRLTRIAVRMLDNAIDVSRFPLREQRREALAKRRIGLGVTGLADALIFCGVRYGSPESLRLIDRWLGTLSHAAYDASADLATEKGAFPLFEREAFLARPFIATLPAEIRRKIAAHGIRNGLVTSIAPTGTISLFAGNVSSGVEPVFAYRYTRHVLRADGTRSEEQVSDYAYRLFRERFGAEAALPDYFVDTGTLTPGDHLAVQAAAQRHIDSAISKTINVPEQIAFDDFKDVYLQAYEMGCKGCTTYRPNAITGAVLEKNPPAQIAGAPTVQSASQSTPQPGLQDGSTALPPPAAGTSPAAGISPAAHGDGVVYMTRPLDRPETLPGTTYKIKWQDSDHAFYITINDIEQDGRRRPFEIFINSKNMEAYAWTLALTRMVSAVFRRGGDVSFVVEELKAVFDPRGGQWMGGRYVPSLLAAIGEVIERHLIAIGFMTPPEEAAAPAKDRRAMAMAAEGLPARFCPRCSAPGFVKIEGCDTCVTCGYSRCN
ncbi:MAG: adenosylcobalamin-dependent ribonucleoside-diphosphate reductase [Alphaproteobacteria bacterium]|nr:adenosylcobalamin-dependent ribonucleoside-diphosphate reductase [Alphaproteobacteria bacterium]MBN9568162.1 adenosylcobalamin-dependent ribonucleoside-diphosphate reductase [Alphaproteobacteria bacterium]